MQKLKVKADFYKETRNYRRYKMSGDCLGDLYIPKNITDQVIEFDIGIGSAEKKAEK